MLITNMENALKIKDKVSNVLIYTLDKVPPKELKGVFPATGMLPSDELTNKVVDGDMKKKKAIAKHVKRVKKMAAGDDVTLTMCTLVQVTKRKKSKNTPLVILVQEDKTDIGKFHKAAIEAAFKQVFGIKMLSMKTLKKAKALKGKKKKRKAAVSKIALKATSLSNKGQKFHKTARKFYFPENLWAEVIGAHLDSPKMLSVIKKMRLKGKNKNGKKNDSFIILMDLIKNDKKIAKAYKKFRKLEALKALDVKAQKLDKKGKKLSKNKEMVWMLFLCYLVATRKGFKPGMGKDFNDFFAPLLNAVDKQKGTDYKKLFNEAMKKEA